MRILLTGINGQVGHQLLRTLQPIGEVIAVDRQQCNLANPDQLRQVIRDVRPAIIVNPAAYTAVDRAESEPDLAGSINGIAPGILAEEAKRMDALLVHYSTDYVFDGSVGRTYVESDQTNPLGVYGRTKLAGELAIGNMGCRHLIFRTCWVYGNHGQNFMRTMLRLAGERDELRVVADQHGSPTWSRMIAEATALAVAGYSGQTGIYHLAASGETTWHGFASAIIEYANTVGLLDRQVPVCRITSADFPTPARRPGNSRLNCERLNADFGLRLPEWPVQLQLCLQERLASAV